MKITQVLLDDLTAQAKASPRLRMYYDPLCPSIGTGNPPKRWFVYGVGWWRSSMMNSRPAAR